MRNPASYLSISDGIYSVNRFEFSVAVTNVADRRAIGQGGRFFGDPTLNDGSYVPESFSWSDLGPFVPVSARVTAIDGTLKDARPFDRKPDMSRWSNVIFSVTFAGLGETPTMTTVLGPTITVPEPSAAAESPWG